MTSRYACSNVGLFCGNIGLSCGNTGLFCRNTRLLCENIGLFCRSDTDGEHGEDLVNPFLYASCSFEGI